MGAPPLVSRVEDWRRLPRGLSLSVAPRFLWECLTSRTVGRFPAPAASNPAGGFPALGFPACFMPKLMGPILLVELSAQTDEPGMRETTRVRHTARAYSTAASRSLSASAPASDAAESSFSTQSLTNEKHRLECPTAK